MAAQPIEVAMIVRDEPAVGGLELSFARLTTALRAEGIHGRAIVLSGPDDGASLLALSNYLPTERVRGHHALRAAVCGIDVVHFHAPDLLAWPLRAAVALRRSRVPLVLTVHLPAYPPTRAGSLGSLRVGLVLLARGAVMRATMAAVCAPSERAAAEARSRSGPWVRTRALWNGVPDPGPSPLPDDVPLRLVMVGRLADQKRPHVLLQAIAELKRRGLAVNAEFIGDGPQRAELEALGHRLGLDHLISITGAMADPLERVRAAHLLVLTSRAEGCPTVAIEAAALGRGTVAWQGLEGVTEAWGGGAALAKVGNDPMALADLLQELAGSPAAVAALGRNAREVYDNRFTDGIAAQAWARLYREVLQPT